MPNVLYVKKDENLEAFIAAVLKEHPNWEHATTSPNGDAYAVTFAEKKIPKLTPLQINESAPATNEPTGPNVLKPDEEDTQIEKFANVFSAHIKSIIDATVSKKLNLLQEEVKSLRDEINRQQSTLEKEQQAYKLNIARITDEHNCLVKWKETFIDFLKGMPFNAINLDEQTVASVQTTKK